MTRFAIISGSTRPQSQSAKVAGYLRDTLTAMLQDCEVAVIDLSRTGLPNWHEGFWEDAIPDATWAEVSATLSAADGLIVVAPEWNGMAPPALLNVFLLTSRGEVAHKPALAVTVSATGGGANPLAQLRAFSAKNTQICYLPDHVIVRDARNLLNGDEPQSEADAYLRERIDYSLRVLVVYTAAFVGIRRSGVIDLESFPYGM